MTHSAIVLIFDSVQHDDSHAHSNPWKRTPHFAPFACDDAMPVAHCAFENSDIEKLPPVRHCALSMAGGMPLNRGNIAALCWACLMDTARVCECPLFRLPKYGYTRDVDRVWFLHDHEDKQYDSMRAPFYR